MEILESNSYSNHIFIISLDIFLLVLLFLYFVHKMLSRTNQTRILSPSLSCLQISCAIFTTGLGLIHLVWGIWILASILIKENGSVAPVHQWLFLLIQGITWVLIGLFVSVLANRLTASSPRMWTTCAFLFSALLFGSSVYTFLIQRKISNELVLDVLCFPGAILVLFCAIKGSKFDETVEGKHLYEPLTDGALYLEERNSDISATVTPFAKAGFFSQMSFWWLNSLMGKGRHKPLEDSDIPQLRPTDRAEYCYRLFSEELNKQREAKKKESPSILWTIISCYHKDILISGFFALLKILTISAGPMLLRAFIKVAEGHGSFQYEGCLLAALMFISKALESISQRQWYFRSRIIGLRVKSLLSAAIYRKQLRLSNIAKMVHSSGEIMNYITVDAYRIGEFPYWFHYTWTTSLQLCIALLILYNAVGLATVASLLVIIVTVAGNAPLAKLQHKFQTKLMEAQDERLKAMTESLVNMKILKLYAWENHFKIAIEELRKVELKWLSAFQLRKAYNSFLFWSSPVLVSAVTFVSCYFLQVPLYPSNVFTFIATLRLVQEPIRIIPDVIGVVIQGKVALERIVKFLEAPELQDGNVQKVFDGVPRRYISINQANFSWQGSLSKLTLRNLNLDIKPGEKVAICGEVGAGKSSLLAAVLGEIPKINGSVHVSGTIAYVSQTAWIQMGTIRDNVLFGSVLDKQRYRETIEKCSLVKDLEMLPHGDLTEIGERGVNLSGGQKQRIQLARALYQNADIYLLDDPFSAVDAHTSTSLFNDYVMKGLSGKTVLLVSHQVDFFPAFDSILVMADGEIIHAASYLELLATSKEFQNLVDAYKDTRTNSPVSLPEDSDLSLKKIETTYIEKKWNVSSASSNQLIKQEEKETGDMGLKPYLQYLNQNKGFLYFFLAGIFHLTFVSGQILQNSWMAANVQNPRVSTLHLIIVYSAIGISSTFFLLLRSIFVVVLGIQSSRSLFSHMLNSIFQAPMSFFDSTPLGRILSRVSSDLSIVDIDIPFTLVFALCATINSYSNLGVLGVVTWQVLFVSIPMIYLSIRLQRYYLSSAKELMRINGTTKSVVANHLAESIVGATIIRAFKDEDRFFSKNLDIINKNASPFFHSFTANEWLIGRLELMSAGVLSSSALVMSLLPSGTYGSGFIGLALSYGLSLNVSLVFSIQNQCTLANYIISVERLNQYMHIPSEGEKVTASNCPSPHWPDVGKVEFRDLKVRYHPGTPLVLRGISCIFEGGKKIGIVGRTGSGKSTLIGALFRLVAPAGGEIVVDGIDISKIDLHDLRSRFGIIPQDPTLFRGTVRLNLDPMHQYSDQEIWQVLEKCQLHEAVQEKEKGLDSLVVEEGLNWSMGQRQLFCLGRALLRRSRILVLDEATALIDNATDAILQKTIRKEFVECTVITVAHRIPTVMDCDMVLTLSDGKLVEYDQPMKLISSQSSMFGELVKEYWAHTKTFAGPY